MGHLHPKKLICKVCITVPYWDMLHSIIVFLILVPQGPYTAKEVNMESAHPKIAYQICHSFLHVRSYVSST